jgi:hypothetical protein
VRRALAAPLLAALLCTAAAAGEDGHLRISVPLTADRWTLPPGRGRAENGRLRLSGSAGDPAEASAVVPLPPSNARVLVSGWVTSPARRGARLKVLSGAIPSPSRYASGGRRELLSVVSRAGAEKDGSLTVVLEAFGPDVELSDLRVVLFRSRMAYTETNLLESDPAAEGRLKVFFFGGSTVAGAGSIPFPLIFQLLTEAWSTRPYWTCNLGRSGVILPEHILSWTRLPLTDRSALSVGSVEDFRWTGEEEPPRTGVRDLRPGAVVICSMWNDFINQIFVRDGRVPARRDGTPLTALYLKAVIDDVLRPGGAAAAALRDLGAVLREYAASGKLSDPDLRLIPRPEAMSRHYRFLLERFIEEIRTSHPDIPVVLLTLPLQATADSSPQMRAYVEKKGFRQIISHHDLGLDFFALADRAQVLESRRAARRFPKTSFVDLSGAYRADVEGTTPKAQADLGYFSDDLMHFTTPGNQFLADKLFMEWLERVEKAPSQ